MKVLFGFALFCNVLAIGFILAEQSSDWMSWVNLVGCVVFGWYLHEMKSAA